MPRLNISIHDLVRDWFCLWWLRQAIAAGRVGGRTTVCGAATYLRVPRFLRAPRLHALCGTARRALPAALPGHLRSPPSPRDRRRPCLTSGVLRGKQTTRERTLRFSTPPHRPTYPSRGTCPHLPRRDSGTAWPRRFHYTHRCRPQNGTQYQAARASKHARHRAQMPPLGRPVRSHTVLLYRGWYTTCACSLCHSYQDASSFNSTGRCSMTGLAVNSCGVSPPGTRLNKLHHAPLLSIRAFHYLPATHQLSAAARTSRPYRHTFRARPAAAFRLHALYLPRRGTRPHFPHLTRGRRGTRKRGFLPAPLWVASTLGRLPI